jgi:hypothetical protein
MGRVEGAEEAPTIMQSPNHRGKLEEISGDNRLHKAENFLPVNSAFCSFEFRPSEESWMTSEPLVLKASEMRFPAIAAPPVSQKSDKTKIFCLIRVLGNARRSIRSFFGC